GGRVALPTAAATGIRSRNGAAASADTPPRRSRGAGATRAGTCTSPRRLAGVHPAAARSILEAGSVLRAAALVGLGRLSENAIARVGLYRCRKRLENECVRPFYLVGRARSATTVLSSFGGCFPLLVSWCFCISVPTWNARRKDSGERKLTPKKEFVPPAMFFRGTGSAKNGCFG
ncbi:unnamed protein product, partial [Ectocarpus sp. 12 AP-2014]